MAVIRSATLDHVMTTLQRQVANADELRERQARRDSLVELLREIAEPVTEPLMAAAAAATDIPKPGDQAGCIAA